jgi:hypothetical protein
MRIVASGRMHFIRILKDVRRVWKAASYE